MAESAARSVLGKISQGHLECPVCCCYFIHPKTLTCQHNFCATCLEGVMNQLQPRPDEIACPVCRQKTPIPESGLKGLPDCFFLRSLIDEVKKQEELLREKSSMDAICNGCDKGNEAVWRCLDCDQDICQECKEGHQESESTKKHQMKRVGESGIESHDPKKIRPDCHRCKKHADQGVCFYCDPCEMFICAKCAALDHRSQDHQYSEISSAAQSFRNNVEKALQEFEKGMEKFTTTNRSIEHSRSRLNAKANRACQDITSKEEEEISKMRRKYRILRERVLNISEGRDEEFQKCLSSNAEKMEKAEGIVKSVNDLMKQTDIELLNKRPKIQQDLEFRRDMALEQVDHSRSFIGVKCRDVVGDEDLGKVLTKERWELKFEFGQEGFEDGKFKFATDVACFSNGDIVVSDLSKKQIMIFTPEGRFKTTVCQKVSGLKMKAVRSIAVDSSDHIVIARKRRVSVFDKDLSGLWEFTARNNTQLDEQSSLVGIDVKTDRIAVVDKKGRRASLHKMDGSLIADFANDMLDGDVALSSKDRLVFTCYGKKLILCTSFQGRKLFNISSLFLGNPAGVCCDETGDIYVSFHSDEGSCEIHHYDPNGLHMERVARDLLNPMGITFAPSGDLVVADRISVKVFHRV